MYQYQAYTFDRKIVEGTIDASSEEAAESLLRDAGYHQVLTLKKTLSGYSFRGLFSGFRNVTKPDIIDFFNQLATLIDSRMPFVQALGILAEQAPKTGMKAIIARLGQDVAGGTSFSHALTRYPRLISSHYCQVIKVSEKSGNLTDGLRMVAGYMEKETSTSNHVRRMLSYPAFLFTMAFIVIIVVATVAVPSLVNLFTSLNVPLPLPTRMLIAVANFIVNYKFHVLAALVALALALWFLRKQPAVKRLIDVTSLKLPVIGNIIIMRNICRFCRSSAMLIEAGLTLPQALETISGTIDSNIIKQVFIEMRQEVIKGKGLSQPMSKAKIFPRLLVDMVSIGEKTGTLQSSFATMADYYEKRLDMRVQRLLGMIEPASIIFVGLIIALIGVAIITPMYSIYRTVH
ncbi:MAG: type II secretion system F family protein [Dehalococcoidales bacterium]|jgi:type II secretory pathway component PulF